MYKLFFLITCIYFASCNLTKNEKNTSTKDTVCSSFYNYTDTLDLYHGAYVVELFNSKGVQKYIEIMQILTVMTDTADIPNVYAIYKSDTINLRTETAPTWLGNMGVNAGKISNYTGISGNGYILKTSTFQPMGNKLTCQEIDL